MTSDIERRSAVAAMLGAAGGVVWPDPGILTGTTFRWVDSIGTPATPGELRALNGSGDVPKCVVATGFWAKGDGGGGIFAWSPAATPDDGGTIIVPSPNPSGGCWKRLWSEALLVTWFGTGAGVRVPDDGPIQRCMAAGAGHRVVFPAGTYRLTSAVLVSSNTTVVGAPGAVIVQESRSQAIFKLLEVSEVTMEGLTLRGEGPATADSNHAGVYLDHCVRCRVLRCRMSDLDLGIHVASNINESRFCDFSENHISGTFDNGIGVTAHMDHPSGLPQLNHLISRNVITDCGEVSTWGKAIELRRCKNCVVSNNVLTANFFGGFQLEQGCEGVVVEGNIIAGNRRQGIILLTSGVVNTHNTFAHNTIRDNEAQGIHFSGSGTHNAILGNSIMSNGHAGIHVEGLEPQAVVGNRIEGNEIRANLGPGIDLPSAWRNTITGNHVTENGEAGIALRYDGSENVVSCNLLRDNGLRDGSRFAIEVKDSQSRNVVSGNVCGGEKMAGQGGILLEPGTKNNIVTQNQFTGSPRAGISDRGSGTVKAQNVGG